MLGAHIGIGSHIMDNIECDNPGDCVRCCAVLLRYWLDTAPRVTWNEFIDMLTKMLEDPAGLYMLSKFKNLMVFGNKYNGLNI